MHLMISRSSIFFLVFAAIVASAVPAVALGRIVKVEGKVLIKRNSSSNYSPTSPGTELRPGDILKPERGATVIVLCPDKSRWRVPAGIESGFNSGCRDTSLLSRNNLRASAPGPIPDILLGGNNPSIPYVISPRRTYLLTPQPTLRWNAIPNATKYTVQVRGTNDVLYWETSVAGTEVIYAGQQPLKPGEKYLVIVTAEQGQSSQSEKVVGSLSDDLDLKLLYQGAVRGWGFELLDGQKAQSLQMEAKELTQQYDLSQDAKALALAQLQMEYQLFAEAIETLEKLAASGVKTAAIYNLLGSLYGYQGLDLLAEASYSKAVQLAEATQDLDGQATAKTGLARLYEVMGKQKEAILFYNQAIENYKALGDLDSVNGLGAQLAQLSTT